MTKLKPDNNNIGVAGEYFIASILSSKGYITTITLGRAANYDIITIRPNGKSAKIQVKTAWYNNHQFRLSPKDAKDKKVEYFYAFVTLKENKEPWDYFVIPAKIVAKSVRFAHKKWLATPSKTGKKHNDSSVRVFHSIPSPYCPPWFTQKLIDSYKNNIHAIEKR